MHAIVSLWVFFFFLGSGIANIFVSFPFNQVDMLSEINIAPRILTNFTSVMPSQFKKDLDSYLKTRSPVTFLSELRSNLQVPDPSLSHSFNCVLTVQLFVLRFSCMCTFYSCTKQCTTGLENIDLTCKRLTHPNSLCVIFAYT